MKFHWFGINWRVFNQSECRNCCLYIIIQKIAPQTESRKLFWIWFFPQFGGKMAAFWPCACKLSWTLFSPARVQPPYGAGRKESSKTGLNCLTFCKCILYLILNAMIDLKRSFLKQFFQSATFRCELYPLTANRICYSRFIHHRTLWFTYCLWSLNILTYRLL